MKIFFILVTLLITTNCFASGKLTFKESYDIKTEKLTPMLGLSIYQKLFWKTAYNSWTGMGEPQKNLDGQWYVTKHAIDLNISRLTFTVGGQLNYYSVDKTYDKSAFGAVSFRLWE